MLQRPLVAAALGVLAIFAVLSVHDTADETQLEATAEKPVFHAEAQRNCFMRSCSMKNGKEKCVTKHHGCQPMATQWMHSATFEPRFLEHIMPREVGMSFEMPFERHFSQLAGAGKITVTKTKKQAKQHHALKILGGPAAGLTKKQLKAVASYQKKIMAAKKEFLKKAKAAAKLLPKKFRRMLPAAHQAAPGGGPVRIVPAGGPPAGGPAGGCFERQCVSAGGRLQCKVMKLPCGGAAAGGMPAKHMARMLHKMFKGAAGKPGGKHPMVLVVRIHPIMKPISPKKLKKIKQAFKSAINPKVLKKMQKKIKSIVGNKGKNGKPVHLSPKKMKEVKSLMKKTFTPKVVKKVRHNLKKVIGGMAKPSKKFLKKATKANAKMQKKKPKKTAKKVKKTAKKVKKTAKKAKLIVAHKSEKKDDVGSKFEEDSQEDMEENLQEAEDNPDADEVDEEEDLDDLEDDGDLDAQNEALRADVVDAF